MSRYRLCRIRSNCSIPPRDDSDIDDVIDDVIEDKAEAWSRSRAWPLSLYDDDVTMSPCTLALSL
jgi:hypothetical protein